MLRVIDGSITDESNRFLINNMSIIVDTEDGIVLKYGDVDTSNICEYYTIMIDKLSKVNKDMADNIKLIKFDRYNGILSIEDICCIVNYGMNCHSERFMKLFEMNEQDLKNEIKRLRNYGY